MNNILIIAKNIATILFRKKNSILVYIILPILGVFLPLLIFSSRNASMIKIAVIDKDASFLSKGICQDLKTQRRFYISEADELSINTLISSGKLDCALVIPEGYAKSFLTDSPKTINVVSVQGIASTGWIENYLKIAIPQIYNLAKASNGDEEFFTSLYQEYKTSETQVILKDVQNQSVGLSITYLGIGFLIQFAIMGSQRTVSLIIKERKDRTLARIRCAPVKGYEFISGNTLVNLCLLLLQAFVPLLLLKYGFKVDIGTNVGNIMIVLLPLLIASIGLSLMLVSYAKNENQLNILSTIVIYPSCILSGCFWDISIMPDFMQKISRLFPQSWALDAVKSFMMGKELKDVFVNILVISAFALAFFAIAAYGFSRKERVSA